MPAVSEQVVEPGIPDFNSYASLQRFASESLAAGPRYAGLIQNLRRGWEANGNRVAGCWEYAYEDNYTVSRALDAFAMAGNSPEAVYDIAFARGGVASGRGDLVVGARDGTSRGMQGILSYRREYPLGPVERGVHTEANHSHKNAFYDAVYLAPVLAMFVDGAGGQGTPFLSKYLFNAIAQHQSWQEELNLNFHASVPGRLAQKRRQHAAILEDGREIWTGYHDEELNELFLKQQEFANLLQTFIQKARHSRFFKLDAVPGGVYALAKLWYPSDPTGARSSGLVTASVQFKANDGVYPDALLWENGAPAGGGFPNLLPVQDAQRNSFGGFMRSQSAVDRELRSLLFEIIAMLTSPAAVDCLRFAGDYHACDWSKALFAERLQSVLLVGEYVPETYPARPVGSHHVITFPGTAEDEYQQCLRVSPNAFGMAALNQQLNEAAAGPVPPFCAAGGQAIEDGGRAGWRAKPEYDTAGECAGIRGGVFYATPQFGRNNDAGASSTRLRQKLMELEYYRQAKVVWEREKVSAKLRTVDPAMIAADGRFQLPKVRQGGRSSYGSRSFAAIDFDYGFDWSLEGGPAKSFCEFKPAIAVHAGSSVYLLGHSVDIIDYKVSLSSKRKVRVGEILGHELYQPADENLIGRSGRVNVVAEGGYSNSVEYGQTLLIGPIPIDLRMGVTGTLQLSGDLTLDHGVDRVDNACQGPVPSVSLTGSFGPRVKLDAFASAGVGGEIFGVGASAGIRGDLTLVDLALKGGLNATITPSADSPVLAVNNQYGMVFQSMNGSISAYLRVAYLVDTVTWRKKLVGWDGYSLTPSWSTQFSGVELGDLKQALGGQ